MTEDTAQRRDQAQGSAVREETLTAWIGAARGLAQRGRSAAPEAEAELIAVTAHAGRAATRIAIVSVSLKNRVRLVNQLLNRDAVPADPGADVPILVVADGDRLEVQTQAGWHSKPADASRWWQQGEPSALTFRLRIDPATAIAPGVELISVPAPEQGGADGGQDLGDGRWAALASADAVIMLVQATAAMTRTETVLMSELLRRGTVADYALVVVARMDLVEEDERSGLLDHAGERARQISASLKVLPERPEVSGERELAGSVREWITTVVLPNAGTARACQLSRQLVFCLRRIAVSAGTAAREAEHEQARRDEEAAAAEAALTDQLREFDHIREDIRGRHNAALAEFLKERELFASRLETDLLHQLDANPDPAEWWAKELPYQLDSRLPPLGQQIRLSLQQRVSQDTHVLATDLNAKFGVQPQQLTGLAVPEPTAPAPAELDLKDLRRLRLLYRAGPPGVALVAVLAIPGIGPIAALGASLVGIGLAEVKLRGLAEEQRAEIRRRLPALLDNLLNTYGDQVSEVVDEIYRQHEDEIGRLREQWQANATASSVPPVDKAHRWEALRADCEQLIDQIRAEIGTEDSATNTEMGA